MKKIIFYDKFNHHATKYRKDIERIVAVYEKYGYAISHNDALKAWECYSDALAAGWLILPDEDSLIFESTFDYFIEIDPYD
jgi:hypothetical protein